ncbi:MAG: hypothetical protein L0Z50_04145 [Verrucomicrobiales bacterium]|nr:hypothetical protein [Verrucomicrobiales bacterium]
MKEEPTTQGQPRSSPLKSTYNSTSIAFILVIAAVLAAILILWPLGAF